MFARALIVLLVAINLGVALWWMLRPEPSPPSVVEPLPGVPRLQLLSEAKPLATPAATIAPAAASASSIPPPVKAVAAQCFSLGPFATAEALREARARLQSQVRSLRVRDDSTAKPRGYTVLLPPFASRELAQAAADKIRAAGFSDLLLINTGDDANGIALGRYGSLESAQRRQASLQAAGFDAQLRPIGVPALPAWLDIEASAGVDIARLRTETGATQSPTRDCASPR
ncbi:sporulation related protein [Luteimonas cucumeris]|uniref:Sporulation related protein n=1 Tax=Luteimonas cucumeris TaxID=985012 RepID=A0A562L5T5_9GAMM|nr:SPOR domain-containing protein [Luteimonas cucumeris]TWI03047.1 sporulation related protein [Luteimonas cucumeris]